MSKFNILIETRPHGEYWLEANTFNYYFFLAGKLLPSPEQVSYIKETYNNKIEDVSFGYYKICTLHRKTEKEGYALKREGPYYENNDFFKLNKYKEILEEPIQRIRDFETVIIIDFDYGQTHGNMNCAWHDDNNGGFIRINLDYCYKRRAIANSKNREFESYQKSHLNSNKIFDYYDIPPYEDLLSYLPVEDNFAYREADIKNTIDKVIVPYTHHKVEILEKIMNGSEKMGELIRELLFHIEEYENKALPDNTILISKD